MRTSETSTYLVILTMIYCFHDSPDWSPTYHFHELPFQGSTHICSKSTSLVVETLALSNLLPWDSQTLSWITEYHRIHYRFQTVFICPTIFSHPGTTQINQLTTVPFSAYSAEDRMDMQKMGPLPTLVRFCFSSLFQIWWNYYPNYYGHTIHNCYCTRIGEIKWEQGEGVKAELNFTTNGKDWPYRWAARSSMS